MERESAALLSLSLQAAAPSSWKSAVFLQTMPGGPRWDIEVLTQKYSRNYVTKEKLG